MNYRFVFYECTSMKLDDKVTFPLVGLSVGQHLYDLYACVCHFGGIYYYFVHVYFTVTFTMMCLSTISQRYRSLGWALYSIREKPSHRYVVLLQ